MGRFQFTADQIENLKQLKRSLDTEEARIWYQQEIKAEEAARNILNNPEFIAGTNIIPEKLDELFSTMRWFSNNRNLSNLLYKNNGLDEFNQRLRSLLHGPASFPDRVDKFFRLKSIGIQTLSQFLVAFDASSFALVTSQTKDALGLSTEQDEAAVDDAKQKWGITTPEKYVDRTLDYLRDFVIFEQIKNILGLEKYTLVNNILWFSSRRETEASEEMVRAYGSVSIEKDLRDYLAANPSVIEKGLTLVQKEFDTKEVGRIDLLCTDSKCNHVVIELKKDRRNDEVVGQTLRYLGWVEKHHKTKVRGIIIVNEPDERLAYALLPLGNLIRLKFYRVSFAVTDDPQG